MPASICRRAAAIALLCLLVACDVDDGGACEENDDCESDICRDGYCAGSACSDTDDHSDCEEGWRCSYIPPGTVDEIGAAVGEFFGGDGEAEGDYYCRATCGYCSPNYHCEEGKELCVYGPACDDGSC